MFLTLLFFGDVVLQPDEVMTDPISDAPVVEGIVSDAPEMEGIVSDAPEVEGVVSDAPEMEGRKNYYAVNDHVVDNDDVVSTTGVCGVWNAAELVIAI